jgi:hypothetical protein
MAYLNESVPQHLYGFVDKRFLHGMSTDYIDQYEPCVIFGLTSVPSRAWTFSIMCESGAQWARVPLNMLRWEEPRSMTVHPLNELQMWDNHGWEFSVVQYEYLRELNCKYLQRNKNQVPGKYWFTADHSNNGYSLYPPEHKCYHFLLLQDGSGQIAAQPNNRILWEDDSWVRTDTNINYKVVTSKVYYSETSKINPDTTSLTS